MHDLGGPPLGDSPPEAWAPGSRSTPRFSGAGRIGPTPSSKRAPRSARWKRLARDLPTYADREPLVSELQPDRANGLDRRAARAS